MTEQQFTIQDMIDNAIDGNATKIMTGFDQLVGPRVVQALQDKKVEIANRIFNAQSSAEAEQTEDSIENEDDSDSNTEDNVEVDNDTEEENDKDSQPA